MKGDEGGDVCEKADGADAPAKSTFDTTDGPPAIPTRKTDSPLQDLHPGKNLSNSQKCVPETFQQTFLG